MARCACSCCGRGGATEICAKAIPSPCNAVSPFEALAALGHLRVTGMDQSLQRQAIMMHELSRLIQPRAFSDRIFLRPASEIAALNTQLSGSKVACGQSEE